MSIIGDILPYIIGFLVLWAMIEAGSKEKKSGKKICQNYQPTSCTGCTCEYTDPNCPIHGHK